MATARSPVVTAATTICTKPIRLVREKKPETSTDTSRFFYLPTKQTEGHTLDPWLANGYRIKAVGDQASHVPTFEARIDVDDSYVGSTAIEHAKQSR